MRFFNSSYSKASDLPLIITNAYNAIKNLNNQNDIQKKLKPFLKDAEKLLAICRADHEKQQQELKNYAPELSKIEMLFGNLENGNNAILLAVEYGLFEFVMLFLNEIKDKEGKIDQQILKIKNKEGELICDILLKKKKITIEKLYCILLIVCAGSDNKNANYFKNINELLIQFSVFFNKKNLINNESSRAGTLRSLFLKAIYENKVEIFFDQLGYNCLLELCRNRPLDGVIEAIIYFHSPQRENLNKMMNENDRLENNNLIQSILNIYKQLMKYQKFEKFTNNFSDLHLLIVFNDTARIKEVVTQLPERLNDIDRNQRSVLVHMAQHQKFDMILACLEILLQKKSAGQDIFKIIENYSFKIMLQTLFDYYVEAGVQDNGHKVKLQQLINILLKLKINIDLDIVTLKSFKNAVKKGLHVIVDIILCDQSPSWKNFKTLKSHFSESILISELEAYLSNANIHIDNIVGEDLDESLAEQEKTQAKYQESKFLGKSKEKISEQSKEKQQEGALNFQSK